MATILILGDSTSMTIGLEQKSYPYLLANRLSWSEGTKIVNTSQPGITAADAAAFFFRFGQKYSDLKAVIIYLGNCDANANELNKGRMTFSRLAAQKIRETLRIRPVKTRLRNKLMRLEWNDSYNPALESPESYEDFEYNLRRIVLICRRRNIPVILVRPRANHSFPPGLGKGNFIYYHYISLKTRFVSGITHPDQRFLDAYAAYEDGRYKDSADLYKEILDDSVNWISRPEYPLIVAHNYAITCFLQGRVEEALTLFDLLLKEPALSREIVLFNKGFILKFKGDQEGSKECFSQAYDADNSMYRIKQGHLEVIDRLAAANKDTVQLIDMSVFHDSDFVDHCHLGSETQVVFAGMMEKALCGAGLMNGAMTVQIEQSLFNLELSLGNTASFFAYYRVYSGLTEEQIGCDIDSLRRDLGEGDVLTERALVLISEPVAKTVEYSRRHPCFADIRDFLRFSPQSSLDVGRFPEYFIMRRLAPYLEAASCEAPAYGILSKVPDFIHSGREFAAIIPPVEGGIDLDIPSVDAIVDKEWLLRILANIHILLEKHLLQGPRINERLKTTIFWYFREVLRWGSHSRVSMRYERMVLEFIAEALAVASWLDSKLGTGMNKDILEFARRLVRVVQIHEKYCFQFKPEEDNVALFTDYSRALEEEAVSLKGVQARNEVKFL